MDHAYVSPHAATRAIGSRRAVSFRSSGKAAEKCYLPAAWVLDVPDQRIPDAIDDDDLRTLAIDIEAWALDVRM